MKNNNILPPSPYGAGTTYTGTEKRIVAPVDAEVYIADTETLRTERAIGGIATENVIPYPAQVSSPDAYEGAASRQMALEQAEVENIVRAAREAGMSVDQWKASRGKR